MKKILILGVSALMAASFSSCKDDMMTVENPNPADGVLTEDTSYFLNIGITGLADTRSNPEGYDEGTEQENTVNRIFLVFYDSNGDRVSWLQVKSDKDDDSMIQSQAMAGTPGSINHIYQGIIQVDVKHGYGQISQVMAFVNPVDDSNFDKEEFENLKSVENATRETIISPNGYFAMSKSGFYGIDPNGDPNEKVRIIATPITPSQLFTSREKAQAALASGSDDSIVKIYVERYAAKVALTIDPKVNGTTIEIDEYNLAQSLGDIAPFADRKYTLEFVPEYWCVTAYEDKTFVTKSFFERLEKGGMSENFASFDYMNKALTGSTTENATWFWNDEANRRSYWGQSPSYYADDYPRVSDDIMDKDNYDPTDPELRKGGYTLNYYTYNNIANNATQKLNDRSREIEFTSGAYRMKGEHDAIYVRENTVSGNALKEANKNPVASPRAAIGTMLLVGTYKVTGPDSQPLILENPGDAFYVIGNNSQDYKFIKNHDDMFAYYMLSGLKLAKDATGTPVFNAEEMEFEDGYKELFMIKHPSKSVRGPEMVLDSRFVTIQINPETFGTSGKELYALINNRYQKVYLNDPENDDNIDFINQQMMSAGGYARQFTDGHAYFNVSIKHTGFYRSDNENAGLSVNDPEFKWENVQSGDFGLVRNHSYKINVTSIGSLGNAIPDPNTPIVPPTDPDANFIGAQIIVLNWATVPTQDVPL